MKTTTELYDQHQRMFKKTCELATRFANEADPRTGGDALLIHNWGNEVSKQVWARYEARWPKMRAIFERLYNEAEHRRHSNEFRPLWCKHCSN